MAEGQNPGPANLRIRADGRAHSPPWTGRRSWLVGNQPKRREVRRAVVWGSQHGGEGSGEKRGEEGGTSPGRLTRTGRWETDVGGGPNTDPLLRVEQELRKEVIIIFISSILLFCTVFAFFLL